MFKDWPFKNKISKKEMKKMTEHRKGNRFSISEKPFVKERFKVIREALKEIKKKYPEVLSFCIFGSMVRLDRDPALWKTKGKEGPREDSDIDGYLFIDSEKIKGFNEDIDDFYRVSMKYRKFVENLKNKLNFTYDQISDIDTILISKNIINKRLKDGGRSSLFILSRMFCLEVGQGIEKYRNYLIEELEKMGDSGEKFWKMILKNIKLLEQEGGDSKYKKRYPETLKEARKLYYKDLSKIEERKRKEEKKIKSPRSSMDRTRTS